MSQSAVAEYREQFRLLKIEFDSIVSEFSCCNDSDYRRDLIHKAKQIRLLSCELIDLINEALHYLP